MKSLAKAALGDTFPRGVPPAVLALMLVLLDYGTWQRLNQLLGKPKAVSRAAIDGLQRIVFTSPESE